MAADYINKVTLKGRPGTAPEVRYLPSGDMVCNFSIATRSGQHVEWHRIVAYKNLAERAKAQFGAGDLVYIEGEIKTREMLSAEDKAQSRKPRKITEIIATAVHLVEKKGAGSSKDDDVTPAEESRSEATESVAPSSASGVPSYL